MEEEEEEEEEEEVNNPSDMEFEISKIDHSLYTCKYKFEYQTQ